jgi:uncharacterized protein YebE (UPF0316 family)
MLLAILVFLLITLVNLVYAVRLILVTRGKRGISTLLAFIESAVFIYSFGRVATDLSQWDLLAAYCLGTAIGGYLGMVIEARWVTGYVTLHMVVLEQGRELAAALRQQGYGVTEIPSAGQSGPVVQTLTSVMLRRDSAAALRLIRQVAPQAFVTIQEIQSVRRGWLRLLRSPQN